jgi:3alpha(or 20beta)-hydroxysteroid dehydrogenase
MKNILVAGGTDGLGLEIVKLLIEDTSNHVIVLGRNPEKLKSIIGKIDFYKIDVSNEVEVENFEKSFQVQLDILIISVGIFGHGKIEDFTFAQIRNSLEVNLLGHMFLTKALFSQLLPGSRVISINSMSGINATKERSLLCAAKWGLRGFYNALSEEWKGRNIMITQIFPGFFDSEYMDKVGIPKDKGKAIKKELIAKQIVGVCNLPDNVYLPEIQIKNISYT